MTATTIAGSTSVRVVPGFAKRLDRALELAGFRAYGRQKVVSQFSGLSHPGVKKMYTEDRPPRPARLDRLLGNLIQAVAEVKGVALSKETLRDYLLLNRGSLEIDATRPVQNESPSNVNNFDIADFVRDDPVYTSQVIIKIEDVARQLEIDTSVDIDPYDMRLIQFRIVSYCCKNRPAVDSAKVGNMIASLFELAKQRLL